jgi:hypothetical protein
MHPVVQEGVIAGRYRSKENDREQEPAERIAGPTGRQQGTHHCPRQEKAEPGPATLARPSPTASTPSATAVTGATRRDLKIVPTGITVLSARRTGMS